MLKLNLLNLVYDCHFAQIMKNNSQASAFNVKHIKVLKAKITLNLFYENFKLFALSNNL